jgi:3-oxoacyl-[acyl-carrier-protein] synthase-3
MGLVVAATAAAPQPPGEGATAGAARVAGVCLERAGQDRSGIDVLVNLGTYKDGNRIEPASAAFIQRALAMNVDPLRDGFERTTFSFDLNSGPDGFLVAAQAVDALARTGAAQTALLVSSNAATVDSAAPGPARSRIAAAALLHRAGEGARGFADFAFYGGDDGPVEVSGYCDPGEYGPGAAGHVVTDPRPGSRPDERFVLASLQDFLARQAAAPGRFSAVLSSHRNRDFDCLVARLTGARLFPPDDGTHAGIAVYGSALMRAWDRAREAGVLSAGATLLLIEAGGGASAAFAVYVC